MSEGINFHRNASFLLATIGRRAEHQWTQSLRSEGITTSTAVVVFVKSEPNQRGLAKWLGIDSRNAGAIARQLLDRGRIQTRPDATDSRRMLHSHAPPAAA